MNGGQVALHWERSDLRALVQEMAARFADEASRNGCEIQLRGEAPVEAEFDPLRIEQVVANLIANAIKYGRSKPIEIEVASNSHSARLSVRDHGIGVPAEQQERIFEQFARAVSVREYGGPAVGALISPPRLHAQRGALARRRQPRAGGALPIVMLP